MNVLTNAGRRKAAEAQASLTNMNSRTRPTGYVLLGLLFFTAATRARAQTALLPDYTQADAHALSSPNSVSASVNSLATYLTHPFASDEEKTRALFRWITQNITYDVDAFFSGEPVSASAADALQSRRGVCEGYAGLFLELARASGLKAVTISGFAKGYGYSAGQSVDAKANHAWNAVRINDQWRLLDCTWGAGYIGDDRRFHRAFNSHYFFTPPSEFVFDHLPEKKEWQLLDVPLSREDYERSVFVKPKFFALGLVLAGNSDGTIRTAGEAIVKFGISHRVVALAQFIQGNQNSDERQTFVQQEGTILVIRAIPPATGEQTLRLFAKDAGDPGQYDWILDYRVESLNQPNRIPAYPRKLKGFDDRQVLLLEPIAGVLPAASIQKFRLKIPGASQAAVVIDPEWTFLQRNGEDFEGDAPIKQGVIAVCAKYLGRDSWDILLEYEGK